MNGGQSGQVPAPATFQEALILEEFKAARERISKEIDVMNTLEMTFLLGAGAVMAFALTDRTLIQFRASMLLIVLLAAYGWYRYQMHRRIVRIHETYIEEKIETSLQTPGAIQANGLVRYYT